MNHREVVERFLNGKRGTGSAIRTDGRDLFEKGKYTPIAVKLPDGSMLLRKNSDYTHLVPCDKRTYCSEKEMREYCSSTPRSAFIVIHERKQPENLDRIMSDLSSITYDKYGRLIRFPRKKIRGLIEDEILWYAVLRERGAEWERRSNALVVALNSISDSKIENVFKEACEAIRSREYLGEIDSASKSLIVSMMSCLKNRKLPPSKLRQLSSALKKYLPEFRGVGHLHTGPVLALFGRGPIDVVSNMGSGALKMALTAKYILDDSRWIKHTFDNSIADDLIREAVLEKI